MSTELPSSPIRFAGMIRERVPTPYTVTAIGGNMDPPTRVEVCAGGPAVLTVRWDGDAWAHSDGAVIHVLRTADSLDALLSTLRDIE